MTSSDFHAGFAARLGPGLRWALGLSLLSSAAALLWPAQPLVGAATARGPAPETASSSAPAVFPMQTVTTSSDVQMLPGELTQIALDQSTFDPFVGVPPPQPVVTAPAVISTPVAAPPPAAPPATYRFMGRMVDPSGQQLIYLSRGDSTVIAAVGTVLEDGYVVDSIDTDAVVLLYPQTATRVRLSIPAADDKAPH
jgi:hypothetical protein